MRILAGTSGWSYPAWRGGFYDGDLPASRMLAAYATRLPTVEVNNTFYRLPRRATVAAWRDEVSPGFRFALKAPQRITHQLKLAGAEEPVGYFLRAAAELGEALGPLLFQLPPWQRKDLPRLRGFLALLPRGGRAAFEFRHQSWFDGEVLAALADAGAALCVVDGEDGPSPLVATARFGYLRLRRPDYDDDALRAWLARLEGQPWDDAFVYFKHEDARGPAYAMRLAALADAQAGPRAGGSPGAAPEPR
jgi:uncharacterized protein YecE (DUF72 family)